MLASLIAIMVVMAPGGAQTADSLVVSLREADRAVQAVGLTLDHFEEPPRQRMSESDDVFAVRMEDWQARVSRRLAVLATLESLALFTNEQWVTLSPSGVVARPDGSVLVEGTAEVRFEPPADFATEKERQSQEGWEKKREGMIGAHKSQVRAYRRAGGSYDGSSLSDSYRRKLREFEADKEAAMRSIEEAIAARVDAYKTIQLSLVSEAGFAEQIDVPQLTLARQVRVRFRVVEVELSPPNPDANVPVVVGAIVGELVGVE